MWNVEFYTDFSWQHKAVWQTPDTPFMQLAFWQAMTDSGAIGAEAGWLPLYAAASRAGQLVAVMPVFIKDHHQGEYVFDHAWAEAYLRYGAEYYPRLVTSVPYTPVTGQRVWLASGEVLDVALWQVLSQAIAHLAEQVSASSWHGLFVPATMRQVTKEADSDVITRLGCQFMWHNLDGDGQPFADFAGFLATLTAKRRKTIRVERDKVAKQNLVCRRKLGADITAADWQAFYQCYAMTYLVRGRQPYLTLDFFQQIAESQAAHLMLAQALDASGDIVASSLFWYDAHTLYGRYWGSLADYDSLHFELCYYQGIEFAIAQGLTRFDPGTQGEHKLIRGFAPTLTHSLHHVYDARFATPIRQFCAQEAQAVQAYYADALTALPFNADYLAKRGLG
ncbi:GNAT family N-acetyltransferase [Moraxella atlantae]|uniref:Uncharacterized protein conserved in bacteria n=1 Tax=Faucicola atlantae TaxID=34059 RepID=A0A378Q5F5_9GAMM|nr:GNAT family N-acetyltransferase [Moraxella atlantae]OPH37514.1 GNAT family N-acetyltransferase [Moraxella atlantae]STY96073.1 Uncharacterized protein conserved in bacteria [Moraxella atlantae]